MARRPRIQYPAAVCHVMLHRNDCQDVFFNESDRLGFYGLLEEGGNRLRTRAETPPLWQQNLRGHEKTRHKCKDVNPDTFCLGR